MNRWEEYFDTRFSYNSAKNELWTVVGSYLSDRIEFGETVLDAGAGYCYFINNIDTKKKIAVDFNSIPLHYADDDIHSIQGDISNIMINSGEVDTIFVSNVLEHLTVDEILVALKEFHRVLTFDGTLIVITPNFRLQPRSYFDDYTHQTIITDSGMSDMIRSSQFEIIDKKIKFLPFSADGILPVIPLLVRAYLYFPISPFAGQSLFVATPSKKRD